MLSQIKKNYPISQSFTEKINLSFFGMIDVKSLVTEKMVVYL